MLTTPHAVSTREQLARNPRLAKFIFLTLDTFLGSKTIGKCQPPPPAAFLHLAAWQLMHFLTASSTLAQQPAGNVKKHLVAKENNGLSLNRAICFQTSSPTAGKPAWPHHACLQEGFIPPLQPAAPQGPSRGSTSPGPLGLCPESLLPLLFSSPVLSSQKEAPQSYQLCGDMKHPFQ